MTALKDRLLKNRLRYSLEKSYPCDFADMLARVEKYAWADEAFEGQPVIGTGIGEGRKEELEKPLQEESRGRNQQHTQSPLRHRRSRTPPRSCRQSSLIERRHPSPPRKFTNYTPLSIPRIQILMEVRGQIRQARKMKMDPLRQNLNKFCLYHRDHGHDTEDCV